MVTSLTYVNCCSALRRLDTEENKRGRNGGRENGLRCGCCHACLRVCAHGCDTRMCHAVVKEDVAKHAVNASTCEQNVKGVLQDTCSQTEGDHGCEGTRNACKLSSLCVCGMRAGENKNE